MPKVVCTDPLPPELIAKANSFLADDVTFAVVTSFDEQEFADVAADADALLVFHRPIDTPLLRLAPRIRLIQRHGLGYDNVNIDDARAAGVPVCNTPGANADVVAEHTILLMLALLKRFVPAVEATRAGKWPMLEMAQAGIDDLADATVGLVGFGHIGRAVAARLRPFGTEVVYTARRRVSAQIESELQAAYLPFPDLLATSTIVSLHLPLNASTQNLFGDAEFGRMRQGAYLINTSRGGLIDEQALRRAVQRGHLAGAGLDAVINEEAGGNPFTDLPQVLVTPHTAGPTRRGIHAIMTDAFANINRVLAGEPPQNIVPEYLRPL